MCIYIYIINNHIIINSIINNIIVIIARGLPGPRRRRRRPRRLPGRRRGLRRSVYVYMGTTQTHPTPTPDIY